MARLDWEIVENGETVAAFAAHEDAKLFIEECGNSAMRLVHKSPRGAAAGNGQREDLNGHMSH